MNRIGDKGSELEFGFDPDPDQGYRVQCQSWGGMRVAVFLDRDQLREFARQVPEDAEAAA